MSRCLPLVLLLLVLAVCPACRSPYYADRGAAMGAVTGALAGAAIGEHNGNAAAGALLGSAVGALGGAAIGDGIDQDVARSQALIQQRMGRPMSGAVTVDDVMAMTQAGLSEEVITTHIRANGVAQRPQVSDLITLRNAGVRDTVVQALQQTPPPVPSQPPAPAPPVIVEEHYLVAPPYPSPYWHVPPRHRYRREPGFSWGFSVTN